MTEIPSAQSLMDWLTFHLCDMSVVREEDGRWAVVDQITDDVYGRGPTVFAALYAAWDRWEILLNKEGS